ncbi:MAG: phosphatidate cytidylyltransferase [Pseudomonadota bacterium]
MPRPGADFTDLVTRTATGVALAIVGLFAVWHGGLVFLALVSVTMAALTWEALRLAGVTQAVIRIAVASGLVFAAVFLVDTAATTALLALPSVLVLLFGGLGAGAGRSGLAAATVLVIMLAGYVAVALRDGGGVIWILWVILVVVITDICGYFAGRAIGGRKFWPSISPKKTWSGVLAGWLGAGAVGAAFMPSTDTGEGLIAVSIFLSFASQMGDIAESALKRQAGVKDSSNLLPGHGGVLDRLDGVIGALLVLGFVALLTDFPEAPI